MECICIICPQSCRMIVKKGREGLIVEGNGCRRGKEHAINEYIDPKRMLTTTVKVKGGSMRRLAVISDREISKNKLKDCLEVLYAIEVQAPIKAGEIIAENILGTNVNIIASRNMTKTHT